MLTGQIGYGYPTRIINMYPLFADIYLRYPLFILCEFEFYLWIFPDTNFLLFVCIIIKQLQI